MCGTYLDHTLIHYSSHQFTQLNPYFSAIFDEIKTNPPQSKNSVAVTSSFLTKTLSFATGGSDFDPLCIGPGNFAVQRSVTATVAALEAPWGGES